MMGSGVESYQRIIICDIFKSEVLWSCFARNIPEFLVLSFKVLNASKQCPVQDFLLGKTQTIGIGEGETEEERDRIPSLECIFFGEAKRFPISIDGT